MIIPHAPVTFLLPFEEVPEPGGARPSSTGCPVLDAAQDWGSSTSEREGIYETPTVRRHRTEGQPSWN